MAFPQTKLQPKQVHIWIIPLDQTPTPGDLYQHLSDGEIKRADRFHFDRHRRRFAVSHNALRAILAGYLDVHPVDIEYGQTSHGKPWLSGMHKEFGLFFNLTHSHELGVVAVTMEGEVGVDVEYVKTMGDIDGIAARFFSTVEQGAYLGLSDEQRVAGFFNCWTRKEAFIKAIGEGLSHPLDKFDVTLTPGEPAGFLRIGEDAQEAPHWTLLTIQTDPNYIGAVALRSKGISIEHINYY